MTGFRADLDALAELVDSLAAFDSRADELGADVDAQVRRLHGEWTGPAAHAHLAAHERWTAGAAQLRAAVLELRSVVATAQANYGSAAAANVRMWG
jgi:WXG100 family type VII secretion target